MMQSIFSQNDELKKSKSLANIPQVMGIKTVQSCQSNIKDLGFN